MKRLRWLSYFTVAFLFGGGILLVLMNHMGLFEVNAIPVDIVTNAGQAKPLALLETRLKSRIEDSLKILEGRRIWDIDLGGVRASLQRDEWVKDVLISRSFPNQLRVLVRPKTTAAVLISGEGRFIPVTDEGALLSALPAGVLPDVPALRGDVFAKESRKRVTVVKFLSSLPERGPLNAANVSEVRWSNEDGYILTLIHPKIEVKLGEDRVDLKALRVAQVMSYLSTNSLKGRVIDASFSKKVLVRLRKGP